MKAAVYGKLSAGLLSCSVSSSTSRTLERMEAIVKKHSEIMWWSHQTNESSTLRKTLWWLAELQCVVTNQWESGAHGSNREEAF